MDEQISSDEELIKDLQGDVTARKAALRQLFTEPALRKQVIGYIRSHGGATEDGEDAMQEAILIFDKNIRANRFQGTSSLQGYFFGIVKWWWYSKQRSRVNHLEFQPEMYDAHEESHEDLLITEERKSAIRKALEQIGERCKTILTLWGQNESMEIIADVAGLRDRIAAKKEAYRCRERISAFIKSNPNLREQAGL
ncbi:MAG: sigma-70 family RNA polymerase sigma factor [Lewinellaceae bacterium]|nr:sigma-70 family RNA polymerase sigma factor [Lewinellaceae bacterium]